MKKTYLNKKGTPIIRKCENCLSFQKIDNMKDCGYCKMLPLYFSFTHDKSVYGIVKEFYVCEKHILVNEHILKEQGDEVDLENYLKERLQNK